MHIQKRSVNKTTTNKTKKGMSAETESVVVLSHSNLDLYKDDLLYVRIINNSQYGFSSWVITAKYENMSHASFVTGCSSGLAGYDRVVLEVNASV